MQTRLLNTHILRKVFGIQSVFEIKSILIAQLAILIFPVIVLGQHHHEMSPGSPDSSTIEVQPLLAQAGRIDEALKYLGSGLSPDDSRQLNRLKLEKPNAGTFGSLQELLDPYCIAQVDINPEARVKVQRGQAKALLTQNGWKCFLVKVVNDAGVTAQLNVESRNSRDLLVQSDNASVIDNRHLLPIGYAADRFAELRIYRQQPLQSHLSGTKIEYSILQVYSKDPGKKQIELGFNIGQGSQDLGFRNSIDVVFDIKPAVRVKFQVLDEDNSPTMCSLIITDGIEHIISDSSSQSNFENNIAGRSMMIFDHRAKELKGIYPLPSRRLAALDTYPDFYFQPQVYRQSGEYVDLSPGKYNIVYSRGPEYIPQTDELEVPENLDSIVKTVKLKRWVNMEKLGWYSGDSHIHASGCAHYESPEEGVTPEAMYRQVVGEDLNVGAVLTWGPSWYFQKKYFTGASNPLSTDHHVLRYDVEISGFPSSHAGHLVLLGLHEDDYPGTTKIEDWPAWTLPVLKWAKQQHAFSGYAHSGWGLEPVSRTNELPNYVLPKMDGIGANEFVVAVTQHLVDFYSLGDTPAPWELNMYYHILNCGYKLPISGETDFPCIYDENVGLARSYFKPDSALSFDQYLGSLKQGRSYVSDGKSHIINFKINDLEAGRKGSTLNYKGPVKVEISADIAAYLSIRQSESDSVISASPLDVSPYWNLERARIGNTREVKAELIVNGIAVQSKNVIADGKFYNIRFSYDVKRSSWFAIRIFPSSHTNPLYVLLDDQPVLLSKSIEWCKNAVDQCWKTKSARIRSNELQQAKQAYANATLVYAGLLQKAK